MTKFILAEKLNMTQIFAADGKVVPVTVLKASGVKVTQVKTMEKDKYTAVQVGFGKKKNINKAIKGHLKGIANFSKVAEFKVKDSSAYQVGQEISVESFNLGDKVKVTGEMKGRGFTGPVKKYGFKGAPASHGHDHPRAVGSIGQRFPQHTRKGLRMASRMGGTRSVKNLVVVDIDPKKNLIAVKGAVPGANGSVVKVQSM